MKLYPRLDHTHAPATDHLQLEADRRFDDSFRKAHCDWQREDRYYARDPSELEKVRAGDDGHRRFRPTTNYRTHERARHTLIGTIYRRRAKLQREEERRQSIESLRPPPPTLPPEPTFEQRYAFDMWLAELDLESDEVAYEGAPEPVDEMVEYHRDLYPERYSTRRLLTPPLGPGRWRDYLYYYHRLEYFEAA